METIRELLARLTTLTPEELADLRAQIVAEFERLDTDEATVEQVAEMQELAEFGEQAMAEASNREAVAQQAQQDRAAARERIQALNPPAEEETPEETPAAETEEQTEETEPAPAAEQTPAEPVTATGQVERMAARQGTPTPSPEAPSAPARNRAVLTATGNLRGDIDPGQPIEDRMQLGAAMAETLDRLPRHGVRGDVKLAQVRYSYPAERQLGTDAWENEAKFAATNALTATGGICLPVNVDYSVPTWAVADRPLRDALPAYQATRGGIRYVAPPDIGGLAAATGIWTEATDLAPGAATKPIVSIACGTEQLVYVEAISTRLGFGNMLSRFAPEQVAANTDLAMVAAARIQENNLLNLIAAQCVANVTTGTGIGIGATRDLVTAIDQLVWSYRNLHRLSPNQTITAIFPAWVKPLLRADLAREIGHDNSGPWNVWMMSDEQLTTLLEAHGLHCIFHLDGQPSSVSGGVGQLAVTQATGAVNTFPGKLVWYMFAEGMMQVLDAGRLDLGVVRDSTLDATNDYETFVEVFESIAYRGFPNGALQIVSTLCANGTSVGTVDGHSTCA